MSGATYDYEKRQWTGQCPYGDVCSGCDALGYCTRAEGDRPAPAVPPSHQLDRIEATIREAIFSRRPHRGLERDHDDYDHLLDQAKEALERLVGIARAAQEFVDSEERGEAFGYTAKRYGALAAALAAATSQEPA